MHADGPAGLLHLFMPHCCSNPDDEAGFVKPLHTVDSQNLEISEASSNENGNSNGHLDLNEQFDVTRSYRLQTLSRKVKEAEGTQYLVR